MALSFPLNPSVGQVAVVASVSWTYSARGWKRTPNPASLKTVAGQSLLGTGNIPGLSPGQVLGTPKLISVDTVITSANQADYASLPLEFTGAYTVTLSGSDLTLSFAVIPPLTGNASIAFAGGATGNGAATTITRSADSNPVFAVQARNTASTFVVTGV